MRLARYLGEGRVGILDEPVPFLPAGGLLLRTEASGLCSGELMDWYMDRKIPHVLGHELAGIVIESEDPRFPVGSRVAPHHHGPCLRCELCLRGAHVHCETWKRTKLVPGGLAEVVGIPAENLSDVRLADDLRPQDAALMEPLACVAKSISRAGEFRRPAVLGLGVMGLMHALMVGGVAYDPSPLRRDWAKAQGIEARDLHETEPADAIFVCPGSRDAIELALKIAAPDATLVLFSPLGPPGRLDLDFDGTYFRDLKLVMSYSCGPEDTRKALDWIRSGRVRAEQVVERFIAIEELPEAYLAMKRGEIVKPMVIFP